MERCLHFVDNDETSGESKKVWKIKSDKVTCCLFKSDSVKKSQQLSFVLREVIKINFHTRKKVFVKQLMKIFTLNYHFNW